MKLLSIDLETTGVEDPFDSVFKTYPIEFACVPVDTEKEEINNDLAFRRLIKCPSYEYLENNIADFVKDNNKYLIKEAHEKGMEIHDFRNHLENYLNSEQFKNYFGNQNVIILGKSLSSLDFPVLHRYLGWNFITQWQRRNIDVSDIARDRIIQGKLHTKNNRVGTDVLINYFNIKKEAEHTALEDAVDVAKIYFELLKL